MNDFVTVKTFDKPTRAHRAATELEAAEIEVRVVDDEIVAADPLLAQAYGGVKLKVHESQVDQAREILADERDGAVDDAEFPEEAGFEEFSEEEKSEWDEITRGMHCPECGSTSIGLDPLMFFGWIGGSGAVLSTFLWWPASVPYAQLLGAVLFVVGLGAVLIQKFPYSCKECQYVALRDHFTPRGRMEGG